MTEREEFERWAAKRVGLSQDGRVNYAYGATRDAWEVWQARAELGEGTPHCTEKLNALHVNHIALQAEYDALIERHNDLHTLHCNVLAECEALRLELDLCGQLKRGYQEQAAQVMAECEALRKDAERYRWLRSHPEAVCVTVPIHGDWIPAISEQLDAAIDAAMGAMGKEKA